MLSDGAWDEAEDGMWFVPWKVGSEIEELGYNYPLLHRRRSYYPAPSPPARLVPIPGFVLSQAVTKTLMTSSPSPRTSQPASSTPPPGKGQPGSWTLPPRTSHRAIRLRRVARRRSTSPRAWSTSDYSIRMRKECVTSWWILVYQPWSIGFGHEVLARSREFNASQRDCGRRYPSLTSSSTR